MFNNQLTAGPDGFLRDCGVELFPLRSRKFSSALLQVPVCITKLQHPNTRFVARSSRKWSKVARKNKNLYYLFAISKRIANLENNNSALISRLPIQTGLLS